ncbi:MAG: rhodanese-like domain-containing protein [Bacteroidales bacterium]|nr:rhodanese-like domain-containing protein [Bacteroidales bacterium]
MSNIIKYLLAFAILIMAFSCTGIYEDGAELAVDISKNVEQISVEDLNKKIEAGEDFVLIDVRQESEFWTANIPGSVHIPRGILEFNILNEDFWMEQYMYPPDKVESEIVIYCKSGMRGILAVNTLLQLGFKNVKNLKGGYDAFNPNQDPNAKPKTGSGGCGG